MKRTISSKGSPKIPKLDQTVATASYRGRPLHEPSHDKSRPSMLSLVRTEFVDLQGFFTCAFVVLFATNARLVLENLRKYGLLVKFYPPSSIQMLREEYPILMTFLLIHLPLCLSYLLEKRQSIKFFLRGSVAMNPFFFSLLFFNVLSIVAVPHAVITVYQNRSPVSAMLILVLAVSWVFKLFSFHHVCWDARIAKLRNDDLETLCQSEEDRKIIKTFPDSITFTGFFVYVWMPTFCYQLSFPRTPRIRWLLALRSFAAMLCCFALMKIITEQYIVKTLDNTFRDANPLHSTRVLTLVLHCLERMLKLAVPCLYVWLLMFIAVFHHYLNFLAEITRFGDRRFYLDWWNALNFSEYWNRWNLPIHNFAARHINRPLRRRDFSRIFTVSVVFLLSALFHEYLVVVPLQIGWTGLVFVTFLLQAPFVMISTHPIFKKFPHMANAVFWVLFCFIGQPIIVFVYYYLYGVRMGQIEDALNLERIRTLQYWV